MKLGTSREAPLRDSESESRGRWSGSEAGPLLHPEPRGIPADPAILLPESKAAGPVSERSLLGGIRDSLKAVWDGWKRIAEKILAVQTFVILFVLFVLVIGPIALLMKLFRKDPMHAAGTAGSFWTVRERTRERLEECLKQF